MLYYLNTNGTVPYENLALEEYLFRRIQPGQVMLYLWQNRRTVVIGRNQNAWQECRFQLLEEEGGFLARRRSGGGAVFHDLGNLNFTFIACEGDYDVTKQLNVLIDAVDGLGLKAEQTGRNDVTIDGRKFSGNAFQSKGIRHCHHGTILIDVDRTQLERYLIVSAEKMQSKGVTSVQARVANLRELAPHIDVATMRSLLIESFGKIYGGQPQELQLSDLDGSELAEITSTFASWEWRLGRPIPFTQEFSHRFAWGGVTVQLQVNEGRIQEAAVFSDALETEFLAALPEAWQGLTFDVANMHKAMMSLVSEGNAELSAMAKDITKILQG